MKLPSSHCQPSTRPVQVSPAQAYLGTGDVDFLSLIFPVKHHERRKQGFLSHRHCHSISFHNHSSPAAICSLLIIQSSPSQRVRRPLDHARACRVVVPCLHPSSRVKSRSFSHRSRRLAPVVHDDRSQRPNPQALTPKAVHIHTMAGPNLPSSFASAAAGQNSGRDRGSTRGDSRGSGSGSGDW